MTLPNNKKIVILGGGTNTYISNHLALSAPAYGNTAIKLTKKFKQHSENKMDVQLILTKMASSDANANEIRQQLKDCNNEILELTSIPNRTEIQERLLQTRYPYKARLESYLSSFEGSNPDTPEDIEAIVDKLIADPDTRVIVFNVAMVDYKPERLYTQNESDFELTQQHVTSDFGKYATRLNTRQLPELHLEMTVQDKIIQKIRKERKDILLVGFKTTCGATKQEQYEKGLKLCKEASANIVFVNDVDKGRINKLQQVLDAIPIAKEMEESTDNIDKTYGKMHSHNLQIQLQEYQNNGLVTPEESSYWYNTRDEALDALVQMVLDRSHLHFTRSTVVDSQTVPWQTSRRVPTKVYTLGSGSSKDVAKGPREIVPNPLIPETFRTVFDWVRSQGAYKKGPTGATVGHFGIALGPNEFLTSKRKTDFNKIEEVGLVRVITDDPDDVFGYKHFFEENHDDQVKYQSNQAVIAFGAKPSVGGQSQRSLFEAFPNLNCIVHFHCPLKTEYRAEFNTTPQFSFECGSHECIASNITGFKEYKVSDTHSIWAGHMDYHGPNIVFNSSIDPQLVINFIDKYWDLSRKTDGLSKDNI